MESPVAKEVQSFQFTGRQANIVALSGAFVPVVVNEPLSSPPVFSPFAISAGGWIYPQPVAAVPSVLTAVLNFVLMEVIIAQDDTWTAAASPASSIAFLLKLYQAFIVR